MTMNGARTKKPLWLLIEGKLLELKSQELAEENREQTIRRIAGELDGHGTNVSRHAGHMIQIRDAVDATLKVGRPLREDLDAAVAALTLEDVIDPARATAGLIGDVGATWPRLKDSERRSDIRRIVEKARLDLLVARARGLGVEDGVRFLITEKIVADVITAALGIGEDEYQRVKAAMEAELAERRRVTTLLETVADQPDDARIKTLIDGNVADELMIELAAVDQGAIDGVKQAMEEELKERQRLADEEAARKAAEAAGPALDAIPADEMLEYIESIREILEFSDQEDEIRTMCGQSDIPQSLVDLVVSEPDKLDELEAKAEAQG